MKAYEEQSFPPKPQTDDGNPQSQQGLGLGFLGDPNRDSNLASSPIDDKLMEIVTEQLQNLVLKEALNEMVQNLAAKYATDEEVGLQQPNDDKLKQIVAQELHHLALKEGLNEVFQNLALKNAIDEGAVLKQSNYEEIVSKQVTTDELQRAGLSCVIDDALASYDVKKSEEKEMDLEVDVNDNESKYEFQSSGWEVNDVSEKGPDHKQDVKDEAENADVKDEEDISDGNEHENDKEEEGIDEENNNSSENEEGDNVNGHENMNEYEIHSVNMVSVHADGKYSKFHYPLRPDAEDCAYYMKMGTCKFGSSCKFNHPPRRRNPGAMEKVTQKEEKSERLGEAECKYYLTSGGCKFGKACRYNHSRGKISVAPILELNFLGLPIRLGEKECPYYMRTGSCKYGLNCRFNHPDPMAVGGGDPLGYGNGGSVSLQGASRSTMSSWSSPRTSNETAPFVPMMFSPTQGIPSPTPEWNGYQASIYPTSERSLPTPPAFAMNNRATETNFYTPHHQQMLVEEFPERPGQLECSYFLKTGDCKYKSNCKFHHPKNQFLKTPLCVLSDKGLPLRPDQNICSHYNRYGICKFGPSCKFDHPENLGNSSAGYGSDQPLF